MMAATDWPKVDSSLPLDLIKSASPISGLFDLDPLRRTSINDALMLDRRTATELSPVKIIPNLSLPVRVFVGGAETAEFHRQSKIFENAWRTVVKSIEYIEMPNKDHFTIIDGMTNPDNLLTKEVLRLLNLK